MFSNFFKSSKTNIAKRYKDGYLEVDNWKISEFITRKIIPISGFVPYPVSELSLMIATVCWFKPNHVFEWGTHIGKSARIFYETSKYFGLNYEVHSIDLPDNVEHIEHPHSKRGRLVKGLRSVHLYQGDGIVISKQIIKKNKISKALFFCDGDHSFDSVSGELEQIYADSAKHAIIVHDTFNQVSGSRYNIGPYKAVNAFIKKHPDKYYVHSVDTGLPGMTLLLPKKI